MGKHFENRLERIRTRGEGGFTLIELLVVLLIIGILLGIAIPTFLSVTKGAGNTVVDSNLQTALTAADAYYTQNQASYTNLNNAAIAPQDTSVSFVDGGGASTGASTIAYDLLDNQDLVLAAWSSSGGRCYAIADLKAATAPTGGGTGLTASNVNYGYWTPAAATGATACTGSNAYSTITNWTTGSFPQ